MQMFKKSLLGFAGAYSWILLKINGYNIILPDIIDTNKTHAGHVHLSARKNLKKVSLLKDEPWFVRKLIEFSCLRNFAYSLRPETEIRTAFPYTIELFFIYRFLCVERFFHLTGTL